MTNVRRLVSFANYSMHPNNKHIKGYKFKALAKEFPALEDFLFVNEHGKDTLDFSDKDCVRLFNQALLKKYYGVAHWDIPAGNLCPTVPGRADYLHYVQDIIGVGEKRILDIGTGASVIYPLLGQAAFAWSFVGTDIDKQALAHAQQLLHSNTISLEQIELKAQENEQYIFQGIIKPTDLFDACICNPPFFESEKQALSWNIKKWKGNQGKQVGTVNELIFEGGEQAFITQMITESVGFQKQIKLFSCLVSRKSTMSFIEATCSKLGINQLRFVAMKTGRKHTRLAVWSFQKNVLA